jgi:cell fate (sporulation/competence/biofilm development) regulator YlbF (YheA/YmcA/DUF963 family)
MQEILAKAADLAQAIKKSKVYRSLLAAQDRLEKDGATKKLMQDFDEQSRQIREKEKKLTPVEVEDKRKLQQLRDQMQSNELVQELLRAQADYAQMMAKVNETIEMALQPR